MPLQPVFRHIVQLHLVILGGLVRIVTGRSTVYFTAPQWQEPVKERVSVSEEVDAMVHEIIVVWMSCRWPPNEYCQPEGSSYSNE